MKSMYFREYVCKFSRKSHYFCILGVSHLNLNAIETTVSYVWATMCESNVYILKCFPGQIRSPFQTPAPIVKDTGQFRPSTYIE